MNNTLYKYLGFWWTSVLNEPDSSMVYGPYCSDCQSDLKIPTEVFDDPFNTYLNEYDAKSRWVGVLVCDLCGKKHQLKESINSLKYKVSLKMKSNYRSTLQKVSLDEPITQVKVRDQDDKYFLAAKIGQKDGKRVGVVYFGEKNKDQKKEDYSQIFVDLDEDQIRFDKSNKHPKDVLTKMSVVFSETSSEFSFKKEGGDN